MISLQKQGRSFEVRPAKPIEIIDLRWRILRGGLPRSEAIFQGDEELTTYHFAAIETTNEQNPHVVCCATFHLNQWETEPAYQLRGMATEADCRGFGLGRALLEMAERDILVQSVIRQLWCNARTPALEFYRKLGWEVRSTVFDIPTAGPHVKMTKRLP